MSGYFKCQEKLNLKLSAARRSSLTQVSNISSARSFLRVGLTAQKTHSEWYCDTICLYNRPPPPFFFYFSFFKSHFLESLVQHSSLFTVCVQLWIPPAPPQSEACLGWWPAPPWRAHRNPLHSTSGSAPWPPKAAKCVMVLSFYLIFLC